MKKNRHKRNRFSALRNRACREYARRCRRLTLETLETRDLLTAVISIQAGDSSLTEPWTYGTPHQYTDSGTVIVSRTGDTSGDLYVPLITDIEPNLADQWDYFFRIEGNSTVCPGSGYAIPCAFLPDGATSVEIPVYPAWDDVEEPTETLKIALGDGDGYDLADPDQRAIYTIVNRSPAVSITGSGPIPESGPGRTFTISRNDFANRGELAVSYAITGTALGDALSPFKDFTVTGSGVIPAGQASTTITITPVNDCRDEENESVILRLFDGDGYTLDLHIASASIWDDDAPLTLSIADTTVSEGQGVASFQASLSCAAEEPISVSYRTSGDVPPPGWATPTVDFVPVSDGLLNFAPNTTQATATIPIINDTLNEFTEYFSVELLNASGDVVLADSEGVATLIDNDPLPTISVADVAADEQLTELTFTVTLSAVSGKTVVVDYTTSDGSALDPVDYVAQSGTLTFLPGAVTQTVVVPLEDDAIYSKCK